MRGNQTTLTFYTPGQGEPVGSLKEVLRGNGAKVEYTYDSLNRLDTLINRAAGGAAMTSFDYTYDPNGNITRIDLAERRGVGIHG